MFLRLLYPVKLREVVVLNLILCVFVVVRLILILFFIQIRILVVVMLVDLVMFGIVIMFASLDLGIDSICLGVWIFFSFHHLVVGAIHRNFDLKMELLILENCELLKSFGPEAKDGSKDRLGLRRAHRGSSSETIVHYVEKS